MVEISGESRQATLTERQVACLNGVGQHKSAKEIGRELGISNHAVEKHLKAARQKLGAASTVEALRIYRRGTVEPHYAPSDLFADHSAAHPNHPGQINDAALMSFTARPRRIWEVEYELNAQQTLAAIGITILGILVVFALIMAIAQGAYAIWPF
jgi:DNA-binding CsgD family transcriptional regulator